MKNVMPWIKSNLAIVILSAVIIIILPAAFVGSSMWNKKIKQGREKAVQEKWQALEVAKVTYSLPPSVPGGKATDFPWPAPNPGATAFFRTERSKIEEQIKKITTVADEINKLNHKPLLEGVFPTPTEKIKALEFAEALVGKKDGKPSAYQLLLDGIKAGPAADPVRVLEAIKDEQSKALAKSQAEKNTEKLTEEENKKLIDELAKIRIGQYQAHAQSISVYATRDALPAGLLAVVPTETPPVTDCWRWQEDYWAIADLLAAVKAANTIDGKLEGVDKSVVKRIEQMVLFPLEASTGSTITGRKNSSANKSFDVRMAQMKVVVSSSRLPQYINAISSTNFMTVTGLEFAEVDAMKDLDDGYYYGNEHVVRATLTIETIWLRSWTTAVMPEEEKKRRESTGEEVAAAPAPVASPRSAPRPMADEESKPAKKKGGSTKRPKPKGGE